jgi:hypothetical protein
VKTIKGEPYRIRASLQHGAAASHSAGHNDDIVAARGTIGTGSRFGPGLATTFRSEETYRERLAGGGALVA